MRLLLVEDNDPVRMRISERLVEMGFAIDSTTDGDEGAWLAGENDYAVAVLDISLPGASGLEILDILRDRGTSTGVIMITARDAVEDRIRGLDSGADDYLVKPFSLDELLARVRSMLRRAEGHYSAKIQVGPLVLDPKTQSALFRNELLELTAKEYALLELLSLRAGRLVRRADIWEQLYDFDAKTESNVIEVYIRRLRSKLDRPGAPSCIRTRRGQGYVLELDNRSYS